MPKLVEWDEAKARKELMKRLQYSQEARRDIEYRWSENERTVFNTRGHSQSAQVNYSYESSLELGLEDIDNSSSELMVNYAFKNLRFLHAQMSANPPSVVVRPTSNDQDDRRKADAADRLVHHALRHYKMQEKIDKASLNCLLYGTGIMKSVWDSDRGDILEVDDEGNLTLEGDIAITIPAPRNIYIDPDAENDEEIRYVFERIYVPMEEAEFKWPEHKELLEKSRIGGGEQTSSYMQSELSQPKYDAVELFEYWETGTPTNGYLGRHCICTKEGVVLGKVVPNPFRFYSAGTIHEIDSRDDLSDEQKEALIKRLPQIAKLPYHIFTDIDVPNKVWGRATVEYATNLQDTLARVDSVELDNAQAHGNARLILPEGTEVSDDSITNSPWDIIKITGNSPPFFMSSPSLMPELSNLREKSRAVIDVMFGVNESMFGQQSREQSGFSMQYATNQGNMIRRRLFNKYVLFVESVYKSYLMLVRKHWELPRTIHILGKEKALEAVDIKGADIDGGFDLVIEYGASLSLDPMTRREEIMSMQPLFEKAGIPTRVSLKMMKLNELEGMYDMIQLAEDRQREIFEEMLADKRYIPPRQKQDHTNMLAYAMTYLMTTEFKYLEEEEKQLIEKHIDDRAQLAAQEVAPQGGMGGPTPPGPPASVPGELPELPGGEQAPAPEIEG